MQGGDWADSSGPPRRNPARQEPNGEEQHNDRYRGERIVRRDAPKLADHRARDDEADNHPHGDAWNDESEAVPQHHLEDVTGAVATLRGEPWVDPDRVLLLGHSTGGFAVTAAAANNPPGVVGILDFAGGHGSAGPDRVCRVLRRQRLVRPRQ